MEALKVQNKFELKQCKRIAELSLAQKKVYRGLIVDDEPWVGSVLQEFCELSPELSVDLCYNGLEAIEKARECDYDFATVDLVMPELSGVETVKRLKQLSPHLPIMIVTGNATDKLKLESGCAGARIILEKPVDVEEFLESVADLLSDR
jgi:CheY-like chemotaxis protein